MDNDDDQRGAKQNTQPSPSLPRPPSVPGAAAVKYGSLFLDAPFHPDPALAAAMVATPPLVAAVVMAAAAAKEKK